MLDFDTGYTQQRLDFLLKAIGGKEVAPFSRPDGLDHVRYVKTDAGKFILEAPYALSILDANDWRATPTVNVPDRYRAGGRDVPCWLKGWVTEYVPMRACYWNPEAVIRLHTTQREIAKGLDIGAIAAKLCEIDLESAGYGWVNHSQLTEGK